MKYSLLWFPLISDILIAFWDLENIVHRSVNFIDVVIVNETDFHETVDSHELEKDPLIFFNRLLCCPFHGFAWVLFCPNWSVVTQNNT